MVEISSPLSKENRLQISGASSGLNGDRSLILSQNPFSQYQTPTPDPQTLEVLEANQSSLNVVSDGIISLRQRIDSLTASFSALSNIIINDNALENFRENQRRDQERRLAEQALRDESESAIERKIDSALTPTVSNVAEQTTSELNSLMGVFSKLFLGWLGYQGISALQSQINGNVDRLNQIRQNVTGDFGVAENVFLNIRNGFNDISNTILGISGQIGKSVAEGLIINPFRSFFGLSETDNKNQDQNQNQSSSNFPSQNNNSTPPASEPGSDFIDKSPVNPQSSAILDNLFGRPPGTTDEMIKNEKNKISLDQISSVPSSQASDFLYVNQQSSFGDFISPTENTTPNNTQPTPPKQTTELKPLVPLTNSLDIASLNPSQSSTTTSSQAQTPLINPQKVQQQSEKMAESVTPKENLSVSFSDQITNINKVISESNDEGKTFSSMNMASVLNESKEPRIENYYSQYVSESPKEEFIFSKSEKSFVENIPKREISVGPLSKPQPNIVIAPVPQPQKSLSSNSNSTVGSNNVPAIPSSNLDNFYILYSKVHYNII